MLLLSYFEMYFHVYAFYVYVLNTFEMMIFAV